MHDLVHDLASCIAGDEYFVEDSGSVKNITKRTRHVSSSILVSMRISSPRLRSLILPYNEILATSEFEFIDFMRLRALILKGNGIKVVPDCIGEMIYLRCLDLSCNYYLQSLPESICLLRNMQTLNLSACSYFLSLPKNIGNMSNLIHLNLRGFDDLSGMPVGIGQLTRLRTLSYFTVGKGSSSGIGGLQLLNKLGETLTISRLRLVKNEEEPKEANLMSKKDVRSLGLFWTGLRLREDELLSPGRQQQQENVIEGLQPHVNVRELEVRGYQGETLSPSWLTEASLLPNLVQICFSHCTCEHLGSLRKLPRLKVLKLLKMDSLKFIVEEEVMDGADDANAGGIGFPLLEELSLEWMPNLKGWSSSSSLSSSTEASAEEEGFSSLERLSLEEPMCNLEGSSSSSSQVPAAAEIPCLKSKSAKKKLERCPKLLKRGLKNLPPLKILIIRFCGALKRLPQLDKTSLRTLTIQHCNEMEFSKEDFEHLVVLERFNLEGLYNLTCFPEGLKHSAATLRYLRFLPRPRHGAPVYLPNWIGTTLTSLEYLFGN